MDVAINSANRQLGIIARGFKNKNSHTFTIVLLCKSFVRPLQERNSIIWSPYTNTWQTANDLSPMVVKCDEQIDAGYHPEVH